MDRYVREIFGVLDEHILEMGRSGEIDRRAVSELRVVFLVARDGVLAELLLSFGDRGQDAPGSRTHK